MKAHELARELNISHKELLNYLQQNRLTRNPSAPLPPNAIEAARSRRVDVLIVDSALVGGSSDFTLDDLRNTIGRARLSSLDSP